MDLMGFFLGLHATTHAHDVSGGPAGPERWLGGLSDDEFRLRPAAGVNSLVWLLWHMARTEDVAVNLVVAGRAQVFDDAWARRMRVARRDMGTGMTAAEVAELSERADVAAVRAYRSAVGLRTREVVLSLPRAAWDEELGLAFSREDRFDDQQLPFTRPAHDAQQAVHAGDFLDLLLDKPL